MRCLRAALLSFPNLMAPNFLKLSFVKLAICTLIFSTLAFAAAQDRILGPIDSRQLRQLPAGVPLRAKPQFDQGPVDPSFKLSYIALFTVPSATQQVALDQLLGQQQDRRSPLYHKWLTPEQYADRFALNQNDVQKIATWLTSQGFTIIKVAPSRNLIAFRGSAAQVASVFQTEIHNFNVDGENHFSNIGPPSIPTALSNVVAGFGGLNNFHLKPNIARHNSDYTIDLGGGLNYFLAPDDIATMYDLGPLYTTAGIDGTGQTLAVIGQTDLYLNDINDFRAGFGLSTIPSTGAGSCSADPTTDVIILPCDTTNFRYVLVNSDPGGPTAGDIGEADLDIEWSGATARNAQIIYFNAPDPNGNGVWDAWHDAVTSNLAPVITMSYGLCELGEVENGLLNVDEGFLQQANLQGITFMNSSGDSGAASCDPPFNNQNEVIATLGLAVAYPASSPEVTGVGGTMIPIGEYSSQYWNANNGANGGSIVSNVYVPENAWNDDTEIGAFCTVDPTNQFCTHYGIRNAQTAQQALGMSASGGGASNCTTINGNGACTGGFTRPVWQQSLNVFAESATVRFVPDVSLLASPNFPGYIWCTPQSELFNGGSSQSACANGIASALNNGVYVSVVGGTSVSSPVFAGIVALLNQYVVKNGFQASPGLGNVNPNLYEIAKYNRSAFHQVTGGLNAPGGNQIYCQPGTPAGQPAALICPAAVKPATDGLLGFLSANADSATGYNLATGLGSVDANKLATAWGQLLTSSTTQLSLSGASQIFEGQSVTFTVTVAPANASGVATLLNNGTSVGIPAAITNGTGTLSTAQLPVGTDVVTASYNGIYKKSSSNSVTVNVIAPNFTLTPTTSSITTAQGSTAGPDTITISSSTAGFITNSATAQPLTYSCSGLPSEAGCVFSPGGTTTATAVTFSITTMAAVARLRTPLDPAIRIFYAMILPGISGIVFASGSNKRTGRGIRMPGIIIVLGFSTLWLASCGGGGSSGSSGNPGTPKGTYAITINATTGTVQGAAAAVNLTVD
jgi:subtilase family serine protease